MKALIILLTSASVALCAPKPQPTPVRHEAAVQADEIRKAEAKKAAVKQGPTRKEVALQNALENVRLELRSTKSSSEKVKRQLDEAKKINKAIEKEFVTLAKWAKDVEAEKNRAVAKADDKAKDVEKLKKAIKNKFWGRIHIIMLVLPLGLVIGFLIGFSITRSRVERVYVPDAPPAPPVPDPVSPAGDKVQAAATADQLPLVHVDEEFHGAANGSPPPRPKKSRTPKASKPAPKRKR